MNERWAAVFSLCAQRWTCISLCVLQPFKQRLATLFDLAGILVYTAQGAFICEDMYHNHNNRNSDHCWALCYVPGTVLHPFHSLLQWILPTVIWGMYYSPGADETGVKSSRYLPRFLQVEVKLAGWARFSHADELWCSAPLLCSPEPPWRVTRPQSGSR